VHSAKGVLESGMQGTGIDIISKSELFDMSQALKIGM